MTHVTELATAWLTATDQITIELVQTDETPAVVIITWPGKPSVIHPRRFGSAADLAARVFAAAIVRLAQLRRDGKA
jgi:hypothetical protein